MQKKNKYFYIALVSIFFVACSSQKEVWLTVENRSDLERKQEIVEVNISEHLKVLPLEKDQAYWVKDQDGNIQPSQITFDGKLLLQTSLSGKEKIQYVIGKGDVVKYESKVFGRHYPERKGDFSWENDCVGFRFYGKELKEIQAPTSGLDLWYKRTPKLILDNWYRKDLAKEASYHEDYGEGCDPYAVGQTLGGGAMAILSDSILHMNENFESFEVLDKGPLRVTFKLTYPSSKVGGQDIYTSRTISLDAGSQLTQITQGYVIEEALTVAAGFPKRVLGDSILYLSGNDFFVYQEPMDEKNGQIYLGLIIPQGIKDVRVNNQSCVGNSENISTSLPNVIATSEYKSNTPITYYTGFGWNKFGFDNAEAFETYISVYSQKLKEPLIVKFK